MATSQNLSLRARVKLAIVHDCPSKRIVDAVMERMPKRVMRLGKNPGVVDVEDLTPREMGKLVRQVFGEYCAEATEGVGL